jgi:hypothetical protein
MQFNANDWRVGRPSEDEALRFILSYFEIADPKKRKHLMALAEMYARRTIPPISPDN